MSLFDDDRPKKPVAHEIGCDLSMISVAEIDQRITLLEAEIQRLQDERVAKNAGRKAAESLFKS
ncbi:DUF1192 domain-containing protein [Rhizobium sp. FY34]|uniref:DUF1192 domain-containing protein n=1 Tax=Rhizobium sp. FY34 TaxID=2562309 RepID=UPI0010C05931|nr:DUF1192 domain-containing protein [Rhizobium sp. FY34]